MEKDYETLKLMYDQLLKELDNTRDWPIKIMGFSTVLYAGLIGAILFRPCNFNFNCTDKIILTLCLSFVCIWAIIVFTRNHLQYLKYRNIQSRIQNKLEIDKISLENGDKVFPGKWTKTRSVCMYNGFWGWSFFVIYLLILTFISIYLIITRF